jgi:hypothetical protein
VGGGRGTDDIQALAQRMGRLRQIAVWMCLRSDWHLENGRPAEAADDALAVMAMGRHVGQQPVLLAAFGSVSLFLFDLGLHRLAELLPCLPAEQVKALPAAMAELPAALSMAEVLKGELTLGNKLAAPDGIPPEIIERLAAFYGAIVHSNDASTAAFSKTLNDALAKLPPDDRDMPQDLTETAQRLRATLARSQARQTMLRCAMDIILRGEQALADSRDPFGNGPFQCHAVPNGFVLSSDLVFGHRNDRTELEVGERVE